MLTFPYRVCEPCEQHDIESPADHELDTWGDGSGGGGYICESCLTQMSEAAHERRIDAYYGSASPQTIHEQLRGYGHGV